MYYARWLSGLRRPQRAATSAAAPRLPQVMQRHSSTRERLPILDRFYADIGRHCRHRARCWTWPADSTRWRFRGCRLPPSVRYYAYDMYRTWPAS